ncbi:phenylalanine--tRNA ligase subunit alpha [Patescibacteria group bacterium]|nr:phenylalanine--tRNA ligase subunit alpha [Patescibacteria group bacterium]
MFNINNKIINEKDLLRKLEEELSQVNSIDELKNLFARYFGKQGIIKTLFSEIKTLPGKEKKEIASLVQELQKNGLKLFEEKETELKKNQNEQDLIKQAECLDYQIPKIGHLHPITQTIRMLNKIFTEMGYSIMDGPELETDEYCFQRLNVPKDHPARDMQDTIYIQEPNFLLRTQTSSIETRVLANYEPPLKVVCPGKSYRNEKPNKSNHFIFHQYQGFVVMEKISLKDLFGTINYLFKKMYGPDVKIRFRNKYYPEVEPGVGFDMQCFNCKGAGCAMCKKNGWIEMGGAGIIHPFVMEMANCDAEKWKGFAFGLGLDRWVMAKYNIADIRTLLGNNLGYKYYENENII